MKKVYSVLSHLLNYGFITEPVAKDMYGVTGLSQIVSTLRDRGFSIATEGSSPTKYVINLENEFDRTSVSSAPQERVVYAHLLTYGYISNEQAYAQYGIKKLSTVITRIRDRHGVNIAVYVPAAKQKSAADRGHIYVLMQKGAG